MTGSQPSTARVRAAYHAAADHYDQPALAFWEKYGRATIQRMGLAPGASVLDACCGTGASALPAAAAVGPGGRVLGVDLAPGLIELARVKARETGLTQARFQLGDLEELAEPAESFDAVVCVFGIFFLPDMPAAVRRLWQWVRPGGQLAITTWGPRVFEPANGVFWEAIREVRPELCRNFSPWDRISEPATLTDLLTDGGVTAPFVAAESGWHAVATPTDWWTIVMGSGYRGAIEQLQPFERERVRTRMLAEIARRDIRRVETNVIYALARKR